VDRVLAERVGNLEISRFRAFNLRRNTPVAVFLQGFLLRKSGIACADTPGSASDVSNTKAIWNKGILG